MMNEERMTYDTYWHSQTSEVGHLLTNLQRMGNIDLFGPSTLRSGITPIVVMSTEVHNLFQDFSLPDLEMGPGLGGTWSRQGGTRRSPSTA
ncbi:hypothetical protein GIB67_020544 [Kingdonia uniflora]|uniref:Uncharacterized protein n=1 Tax=Kingdonia uniflora TaxID=39325 RepID=A0A7J7NLV3_9MAGN|nr:hypothetical protein GIB67_020544 [Kingdonia uniflora]